MNPDGAITDFVYKSPIKDIFTHSSKYDKCVAEDMVTDVGIWYPTHSKLYELLEAEYMSLTQHNVTYMNPAEKGKEFFEGFDCTSPLNVQTKREQSIFYDEYNLLATITLPYTMTGTGEFSSIHFNPPGVHTSFYTCK